LNLGKYKREGKLLDGYPADFATFWSPRDNIHSLLKDLLQSAERSIVLNMFGYADPELDEIIRKKMENEHVYVQMSLDKTQAAGVHESDLLKLWPADAVGNSLAIGRSSKHAISHLKVLIVDGLYVAKGSTNWSASGESKQDNELSLSRHPVIAAETRTILDLGHSEMLRQMQRTK
jgi:phosphatidylserine/phosphatidylglycerophosphate/cardiolipin synthase-like enzyme